MKRIYFFQPQRGYYVDGKISYYLPYSVGCLWSYAQQNDLIRKSYQPEFIFKRTDLNYLLDHMQEPDIAVFSCYIWNWEYNRRVAEEIKRRWPNCLIQFGGPQITNRPLEKNFFKENPYVDSIINGEGEIAFQNLLLDFLDGIRPNKIIPFTRLTELEYPSPYTSGVFDKIMSEHPDYVWQAVLETNRGCPYACTFCDWGSLTYSKVLKFPEQRVLDEITWMSDRRIDYIVLADANFGILYERDKKFAQHLNDLQTQTGYPKTVIANWAKNAKERIVEIAKIFFSNHKNRGFTISVQSMDEVVLDAIKRKNMEINDMASMLKLCEQEGISPYSEMILGLPYETLASWRSNIDKIMTAGQHNAVDIYFTGMLENSELNTREQRQEHEITYLKVPSGINGTSGAANLDLNEDQTIDEYEYIITSTKYMPFHDLIDSYMFGHIAQTYHYGGWTQILSRFLNRYKNISYLDFYTRLENHIKVTPGIMNDQYFKIKTFIEQFLGGNFFADEVMKRDFHFASWRGVGPLAQQQDLVFEEIFKVFDNEFCGLETELYNELKTLQINSMFDYDRKYPFQTDFKYNIIDYIQYNANDINQPVTVNFSYPHTWASREEFQEKIYFNRRRSILKTQYSVA